MSNSVSNVSVYLAIADEAFAEAQRLDDAARSPKPDGSPGSIIAYDPSRGSFKQSLIALTFSGIYLEALLYLKGTQRMGARWLREMDNESYENKLAELDITEPSFLASAKRLRNARRDVVHEKAVPVAELRPSELRWAQEEAAAAVRFVHAVAGAIENAP